MEKDFDAWNEIKKKTDQGNRAPIKPGEVYWCRIGLNIGVEQDGGTTGYIRPVLIIKKFSHEIALAAPLTTKGKSSNWYYPLPHFGDTSCAILNQARPLDTKRLLGHMGQISENELRKLIASYCKLISE
ncbi:type II toxin-antitoxin system PemK/MazF family toxin [Candidatus Kaiserbacteria bacterium]|nr:type II toxin-antitoxin system PemK/MazF family toxin [Candidatus Kaiserbacteria bacterium]